jgi:hypothetical protein
MALYSQKKLVAAAEAIIGHHKTQQREITNKQHINTPR